LPPGLPGGGHGGVSGSGPAPDQAGTKQTSGLALGGSSEAQKSGDKTSGTTGT
jgi:hypothetical protein